MCEFVDSALSVADMAKRGANDWEVVADFRHCACASVYIFWLVTKHCSAFLKCVTRFFAEKAFDDRSTVRSETCDPVQIFG